MREHAEKKGTGTTIQISTLNAMCRSDFTASLAEIYEHSPWVADRCWEARPFEQLLELHEAMLDVVREASLEDQLALLRAHPELAGKEAQAGSLTASSNEEQSGAGLNMLTHEEMHSIQNWNRQYKSKFGFPFIIAVRGHTKESIFSALQHRLDSDITQERETALEQVGFIALYRLESLINHNN